MRTMQATTYVVTAETRDGTPVWCDLIDGWLVMFYTPTYLDHGPRIREVYVAACSDVNLFRVTVDEIEATKP